MGYDFKKLYYASEQPRSGGLPLRGSPEAYESRYGERFDLYRPWFIAYRRDVSEPAFSYMTGLLCCERGKANMERMEEAIGDLEYHQYQQFISNSPWDYKAVIGKVGEDANQVMQKEREKRGQFTGLIIDESAHLKSGDKSVGVSRQYAGVVGKVENCQVGVYASICSGERSCLINERLFLPECWIGDEKRCEEAGIPVEARVYKSKPVLALEMIDEAVAKGIDFDWIGGDGLYGHSYEFARGLDERGLFFVLDVHKDQQIYLQAPTISIPGQPRSGGYPKNRKGRKPTRPVADGASVRADEYVESLPDEAWQKVRIRKTAKGWLKAWIHIRQVWVWDGEESQARKRTLMVRKSIPQSSVLSLSKGGGEKKEIKYSLSNGSPQQYRIGEFAYFQAQRYWVERDFQNAKSELGMSDYQVRKWLGWHHHHAILFMALLFMLQERLDHETQYPLMSVRDARIMVTTLIAETMLQNEPEMLRQIRLMKERHYKRKFDIDRNYLRDG